MEWKGIYLMKKALFERLTALRNSYLVFIAALLVFAVAAGLYIVLQAKAATPTVTFSRSTGQVTVSASLPANSGYEYKFLVNSHAQQEYWAYSKVRDSSSCNNLGFGSIAGQVIRSDLDDPTSVTATFPYSNTTSDEYYCLKVLYGLQNNSSSVLTSYELFTLDNTKPVVSNNQVGDRLAIKVKDSSSVAKWQVVSATYNQSRTDCRRTTDFNLSGSNNEKRDADSDFEVKQNKASYSLPSADHGKLVCVKVTDAQGNAGYSQPTQVDLEAPRLSSHQANAILTVTVESNDGHTALDSTSWQYTFINTAVCNDSSTGWANLSSLNQATIGSNKITLQLSSSDNDRRYCFRVADRAINYGYVQHLINPVNNPPVISSLSQNKQKVIAQASDSHVDSSSWRYAITTSSVCNNSVSSWSNSNLTTSGNQVNSSTATIDLSNLSIDESLNNKWICLRVADDLVDNFGYKSLDVDVSGPQIKVRQNNAVLQATAESDQDAVVGTWSYVSHEGAFTCNQSAFDFYTPVVSSRVVSLGQQHIGDYFCFRVADRFDNYGYSELYLVSSLDTTDPVISASQTNDILTVKAAKPNQIKTGTWGYVNTGVRDNNVVCNDDDGRNYTAVPANLKVQLSENHIGFWFCVRASDLHNNYGYYPIKIRDLDTTAPVINLVQTNNLLQASSSSSDVDHSTWQYVMLDSSQNLICAERNLSNLNFNRASSHNQNVQLTNASLNNYYCFRVADRFDNYGYALSQQIRALEEAPKLVVVQKTAEKRLEVSTTAADVNGLTWGWVVFGQDPGDCRDVSGWQTITGNNITKATAKIAVSNIADSQANHYYCFRVADTSTVFDNYGYAKHRYDLTAPTIRLSFDPSTDILTIFSEDNDLDTQSWRYGSFSSQPKACAKQNLAHKLPSSAKLDLSSTPAQTWLCFRVADLVGNDAYALYSVSGQMAGQPPVIDVTQTTKVVEASSVATNLDSNSWRVAFFTNEPNCQSVDYSGSQVARSHTFNLSRLDSQPAWVCFTVSNEARQAGFAKHRLDWTAPVIKITQNNIVLRVNSLDEDVDQQTWGYLKSRTDFDCDQSATYTKLTPSSNRLVVRLVASDAGKYYCFKVADRVGHVAYRKVKINSLNFQAPAINLEQTNAVLKATADKIQAHSWRYVRSSSDMNCSSDNTGLKFNRPAAANQQLALTEADNNHWFCFKVTGNNEVAGFAKILVDQVDTHQPQIVVKQADNSLIATSNEAIKSWQYVTLASADVACDREAFDNASAVSRGNKIALSQTDTPVTYCFRAVDSGGNESFKALTVTFPESTDSETAAGEDSDGQLLVIGGVIIIGLIVIGGIILILDSKRPDKPDSEGGFGDEYTQ